MNWLRQIFLRRRIFDDLSEEIEQHLEEKTEALMAEGMSRKEAAASARREFGNVARIEEQGREPWMWAKAESLLADVRFAFRRLRRSPGFTATAVLTLMLSIGANVVVFSLVNGLVLRPLDVPDPQNLFQVLQDKEGWESQSYRDFMDLRDRNDSFKGMVASQRARVGLTVGKSVQTSLGLATSGNYFDVLGVEPVAGRFFHASDEHGVGSAPYVVLSYDLWTRSFNRQADVVGKTVELNKHPMTVIGVAPEDFHGTQAYLWPDYWFPAINTEQVIGSDITKYRDHYGVAVFGRLKPGVTRQQATDSLNALARQMGEEDKKDQGLRLKLAPAGPAGDTDTRNPLLGIMALALLVLLAACVNLASIFAARAADRSGELAVRMAIGSSRWRVLRELVTEAVLISVVGGVMGVVCARVLLGVLSHWQPFGGDFPIHYLILPDAKVYAVALVLSLGSGVLFGLLPARQIWKTDVLQAIKTGSQQSERFRGFAIRDVLLLVQIVVCTLLVTTSLVATRGMRRAMNASLGFDPRGVMTAQGDLRMAGYTEKDSPVLFRRMEEAAAAIPGVSAATVSDALPFLGSGGWFVYPDGTTDFIPKSRLFSANTYLISPTFLKMTGIRLVAGRQFTSSDDGNSPRVALINQTFAQSVFKNKAPIGKYFILWAKVRYEVVGVVEDGKYDSQIEDAKPAMFFSATQGVGGYLPTRMIVSVRSELPQGQITSALRKVVSGVDANIPFTVTSWEDEVDHSTVMARAATVVLSILGMLAAMLAVTGVFGMASYSVAKRMKEQGIRIALGARHFAVMRSMLGRPVTLLLMGSVLGIVLGVMANSVMTKLIAYASPREPMILAGVFGVMILLGVVATVIPARRTLGIDPARLLRE
jgi:predicted permease